MGSCASVQNKDPGFPKKQFLTSPTKAKAANGKGGGGVAPLGDGFGDLKSKAEGEQQRAGFGPKSPDSDGKPVSESTFSSACSTEPTPTVVAKSRKEKAWYSRLLGSEL